MRKSHLVIMVVFIVIILVLIPLVSIKNKKNNTMGSSQPENIPTEEQQQPELQTNTEKTSVEVVPSSNQIQVQKEEMPSNYNKIMENLYFNTQSLQINENIATGTFTEYIPQKNSIVKYKIIQIEAYCDIDSNNGLKQIKLPTYKYYDAEGNFLNEETLNISNQIDGTQQKTNTILANTIEGGNLFFNTLCETH